MNHGGETMQPMQPTTQGRGKEKIVAGILALLLNGFGVHHFYLGSVGAGIVILLSNLLCFAGCLIGFVEGILLLVMSDEEYNQRYNDRVPESMEFVFMKPKTLGGGGGVPPTGMPPNPPPPPYQT